MKKNVLHLLIFLIFTLIINSCRNEDVANQNVNSSREEEFFRDALKKSALLKNGNLIVEILKQQNEKSHFVSKIKDQSGLPIWEKMVISQKSKTGVLNRGEEDVENFETLVIPLTKDSQNLSSILYIKRNEDDSYTINNINNSDLRQIIFDVAYPKTYREKLLSSFIIVDYLTFNQNVSYRNIPNDLFTFIPISQTYPQRRFKITINNPDDTGTNNLLSTEILCINYFIDDPNCSCHGTVTDTHCWQVHVDTGGGGGGGSSEGPGNGGSNGDGGGGSGTGTGGTGGGSDCEEGNKPFYKGTPCDGEDAYPYTYYYNLTQSQRNWLNLNPEIAQGLENYLNSITPYNSGLNFVSWSTTFFMQNPNTSWLQFKKWFINPITTTDLISELQNYPCAQDILQQLPNLTNDIAISMRNVFQNSENYNIIFRAKSGLGNVDGETFYSYSKEFNNFRSVIYLNDQVLQYATKEYILITMYHEVVHAFLDYEKYRLGDIAFHNEYPSVLVGYDYDANNNIINRYSFLPQHNQLGAFLSQLENIISSYNPNLPPATVKAMAKSGITSMTAQEHQLNLNERNVLLNNYQGTKCP